MTYALGTENPHKTIASLQKDLLEARDLAATLMETNRRGQESDHLLCKMAMEREVNRVQFFHEQKINQSHEEAKKDLIKSGCCILSGASCGAPIATSVGYKLSLIAGIGGSALGACIGASGCFFLNYFCLKGGDPVPRAIGMSFHSLNDMEDVSSTDYIQMSPSHRSESKL